MDHSTHSEPGAGTSTKIRDSEIRLHELQSLCSQKDAVIRSLHREVEVERRERAATNLLVEMKTAKIKEWLASRLHEVSSKRSQG